MSSVVSRWHILALLAAASCTDTGSHYYGTSSPDAGTRDAPMGKVSSDSPGTGGTSGSNPNTFHGTGIECFGGASYSVLNERSDELRVQARTRSSVPTPRLIDKTIAAGQMVTLYGLSAIPSGDRCTILPPSGVFGSLRIIADGKVVYEGVRDADWTAYYTLVISPPEMDDAGMDEDAGR